MNNYLIDGNFVVKTKHSGKLDYICDLGEKIFISVELQEKQIIAHGVYCDVLRVIHTYNEYIINADTNPSITINSVLMSFPSSFETILLLNNLVNNIDYDLNFAKLLKCSK